MPITRSDFWRRMCNPFSLNSLPKATTAAAKKVICLLIIGGFGVLAVKAIQEQQSEIEALKKENAALRAKTESLDARLLRLEKMMDEK